MKMKTSFKLAVAISSALAITSGASYAFDLGEETSPDTYAQEINYDTDNGGTLAIDFDAGGESIELADGIGFGVALAQKVYIRYDLSNSTFQTQLTGDQLTVDALGAGNGPFSGPGGSTDVSVVDGGGPEETCVVFEVTAGSGTIGQADTVDFIPTDLNVLDNSQPVTATYNLFSSAPNAACFKPAPVAPELTGTVSGDIIEMGPSLSLEVVEQPTTIAQVDTLFADTDENNSTGAPTEGINVFLATVELALANPIFAADSQQITIAELSGGDNNTLTVAGDFTSANLATDDETVDLSDGGNCAAGNTRIQADLSDPQSAVFEDLLINTEYGLCYGMLDADSDNLSDNPIPASGYTGSIVPVAIAGVDIATIGSENTGRIIRNGTVLRVPYFSKHADSNYVSIANMGSTDAVYTTTCYSKIDGNDPITGLVNQPINAQRTKNLFFSKMCPGFLPGFYDAIEITVSTAVGNVVGSLVRVDSATGKAEYSYITNNEHGE